VFSFGKKKINQSNSTCDVRWETWLCFLAPSPAVRGFVLVTSLYYMKEKTKKKLKKKPVVKDTLNLIKFKMMEKNKKQLKNNKNKNE